MNQPNSPLFLSTAIPYVNAAPHVGHAFELVIADALARHARQRQRPVWLTGGTDDHSLKNARAAQQLGLETRDLVARNGARFKQLSAALDVELDDYLHTASDARHAPAVAELWRRCQAAGDLYLRDYSGWYCAGCEAFLAESESLAGACPTHREPLERVHESNWFFRLSKYEPRLLAALETGSLRVEPIERHNEVLAFVRSGLQDFSVSRSASRARGWGLTVPNDPSQVIYVWFDALTNYLSVLDFGQNSRDFGRYWAEPGAREHLIGKDILRFHAVYWPALLLSAGLALPTRIKVHAFVTLEGNKIGKSLGNVVDPFALAQRYGVDALRYYLLRHLHTTKDSDFREERLSEAHDSELLAKLGNLLQRSTALVARHPQLPVVPSPSASKAALDTELAAAARRARDDVIRAVDDFAPHQALSSIFELIGVANRYADVRAPWKTSRRALQSREFEASLANDLWHLLEALRVGCVLLAPFVPSASRRIATRLGVPPAQLDDLAWARFGAWPRFSVCSGEAPFAPLRGATR